MTKEEILRIKKHIEIHTRQERGAILITEVLRKAVDELEHSAELEKENAELKAENEANENGAKKYAEFYFETNDQLTNAKKILQKVVTDFHNMDCVTVRIDKTIAEAEQFLKDCEVEQ